MLRGMTRDEVVASIKACLFKCCLECPLHGMFTCKRKLLEECLKQLEGGE